MRKTGFALIALCLVAGVALAQTGVITDGDVTFEYDGSDFNPGLANYEVDNGTDHMFQQWWYYRVMGDTSETVFPLPDTESYVGNVATLVWNDVNGLGFSAREVTTVSDTGDNSASLRHDLTIVNNNAGPLMVTVFNYTDLDVDASAGDDSASDLTQTNLGVMETSVANYRGLGSDAFKVTEFLDLRTELDDDLITMLDDSGTPFGPADFTGAFEWRVLMIPAGASATWSAVHNVNDASSPLEIAFAGTCPGAGQLRIAGATPNGTVTVAGADSVGSFTIPGGGCGGTNLNLDPASVGVLGSVTVDGSGARTLPLTLPSSVCGQIAQAVDVATCGTTNADMIP